MHFLQKGLSVFIATQILIQNIQILKKKRIKHQCFKLISNYRSSE